MIVLVSLETGAEGVVTGILQVERRVDPGRQLFSTAPIVASATGTSTDDVLRQLRALAENAAELATHLAAWELAHPQTPRDPQAFRRG